MNPELLERLKKLAAKKAAADDEDFNTYDYSGGNIDDAYTTGTNDGEIFLAREIIKSLENI